MDRGMASAYDAANRFQANHSGERNTVRRRSSLATGIGLALIIVPLIAAPASARSEHERVVAYWTAARLASAWFSDCFRAAAGPGVLEWTGEPSAP